MRPSMKMKMQPCPFCKELFRKGDKIIALQEITSANVNDGTEQIAHFACWEEYEKARKADVKTGSI